MTAAFWLKIWNPAGGRIKATPRNSGCGIAQSAFSANDTKSQGILARISENFCEDCRERGKQDHIRGIVRCCLNKLRLIRLKPINNHQGFKRIYYYEGKHYLLAGIGTNGFIVSAHPVDHLMEEKMYTVKS